MPSDGVGVKSSPGFVSVSPKTTNLAVGHHPRNNGISHKSAAKKDLPVAFLTSAATCKTAKKHRFFLFSRLEKPHYGRDGQRASPLLQPSTGANRIVESYLSSAESGHRGQDAERVAREEDDAVGVSAHAGGLEVVDVVDRVRHAGVLRLGHVGVVRFAVFLKTGGGGRGTEQEVSFV